MSITDEQRLAHAEELVDAIAQNFIDLGSTEANAWAATAAARGWIRHERERLGLATEEDEG